MKSLLIVTSSYPSECGDGPCGAGVFVRDFARCAVEQGVRVTVVTQRMAAPPPCDDGVEVVAYPWSGVGRAAVELSPLNPFTLRHILSLLSRGARAVAEAHRRAAPDRCLCMWAVPAGAMALHALRRAHTPCDVWCLGSDIWRYGRHPLTRRLVRSVLCSADRCFADGPSLAEEAADLAGRACEFLPTSRCLNGVPSVPVHLTPDAANLLFIGRWHPNKGADLLPETMAILRADGVAAHLHLFGGGLLEAEMRALIAEHGVGDLISLHGYADAATSAAYLRACDALVIPSRMESIPVVFSDAAACGIPMAATDVGDLGDMVRRYRTGATCPPDAPHELARAIRKVLSRPRAAYRRGLAQAAADFDLRAVVRRYLQQTDADQPTPQGPAAKN